MVRVKWAVLVLFLVPVAGWSCEPILPLAQLLGGSSAIGPLMWQQSLGWLAAAVAVKSIAFAFFEKRISWGRALGLMLIANILSTIPGVLLAGLAGSINLGLLAIPLVYILGIMVARRVSPILSKSKRRWISGAPIALAFTLFYILSVVIYLLAQETMERHNYRTYWALQFSFVIMVASMGILISSALEEYAIGQLSRKCNPDLFFYAPVIRANYITLGLVLIVAAIQMIPRRWHAPHFLVSYFQGLLAVCGLG
jgi:hypothetical protein